MNPNSEHVHPEPALDSYTRDLLESLGDESNTRNNPADEVSSDNNNHVLKKPWNSQEISYPDADPSLYNDQQFSFAH